jgi:peptide/nickel transport system substrate-binding protein
MRRSTALTVVALAAAFVLAFVAVAAAESPSGSPAPAATPTSSPAAAAGAPIQLHVGLAEEIDGMNPFSSWSGPTWEAFRLNYNFLTWYDEKYDVVPELAKSWEHTPDGKVWTFHIRDDVTWQDGTPLTANDIAFTYNLILDNKLSAYTSYLPFVTKVTATDDTTLVIENSKPASGMLALYIPILPEHIWSKVPKDKLDSWPNIPTVGSGPFQVTQVKMGRYVKLEVNDAYFEGAPTVDEIYIQIYRDPDAAVQDFKAGNLDVIALAGANYLRSVQNVKGSQSGAYPSIGLWEMGFNCWDSPKSKGNPVLKDAAFRNAVHWAIDKKKLVMTCMAGLAEPGTSVVSPLSPYHWEPPADVAVTYDPEKAKQLFDEAGYKDVNGDGKRETKDGQPLRLRLTPLTDYPEEMTAGKMVHQWLLDVGIDNKLAPVEEGTFYDDNWEGDFDIYFWWWGGDIDPGFILSIFTTAQIHSWSDCYYSNPAYDALYAQQASAIDPAQRKQIIDQMQQMLYEEAPYIVLWYPAETQAYRTDKWTGWTQSPPGVGPPIRNYMRTTYLKLKPATGSGSATGKSSGGLSTPQLAVIVAIVVAVVVAVVVVVLVLRRPRKIEE